VKFTPIIHPFTPTERLQEHFRQYLFEYAAFGRERLPLCKEIDCWRIDDKHGNEVGYVCLHHGKEKIADERNLTIAVFDEYRGRKVANAALRFVESRLAGLGIKKLKGQVNTNKPQTGGFVRAWLMKNGFSVKRREEHAEFAHLPDDVYAEGCPRALKFEKTYEHGESAEADVFEDRDEEHYPPVIGSKIVDEMRRRKLIGEQA